jgi:hypothetical protein
MTTEKPVNKRVADYLRQKLVARSGAGSAVVEIANGLSDEELILAHERHTAMEMAKLARKA